jgi:signal transduction histidine kinase
VAHSLETPATVTWWYGADRLYEIAMQPIYFGSPGDQHLLGYLFIGDDIDQGVAEELKQVAASEVAFFAGPDDELVRTTLPADTTAELREKAPSLFDASGNEYRIGNEPYLVTGVELAQRGTEPVHLVVLKSLRDANAFVRNLDSLLLVLGIIAIVVGAVLVFVMSQTFTRPLDRLVDGVRALGHGDYEYPLEVRGKDEVAEVTTAFDRMRTHLRRSQRELLDSERLVTIGRMASSISHDLRHHLVAIMANAEYLSDSRREAERQELCDELRISASQMNDMIESLLELSRPRESLRISEVLIREVVARAVHTVRANPEFSHIPIEIGGDDLACRVDSGKIQRMLQNLLMNACEAVRQQDNACVTVGVSASEGTLNLRVSDNGHGIRDEVRASIFEPFVSDGKENGTGLGLTVVQKIVADHGGQVTIEATSSYGTTMLVTLPIAAPSPPLVALPTVNRR